MNNQLPTQATVVIIGGGIIGCSVAYHLAQRGCRDVLLLEQGEIGSGATSFAAGLVGGAPQAGLRKLIDASAKLYAALEKDTGIATGWKQVGSLVLAQTEARMIQYRRAVPLAQASGLDVNLITADEAKDQWPLLETKDIRGAMRLPADGRVDARQTARALAKGAEKRGATIATGVRVTGILRKHGRAVGVATAQGEIAAEKVVLCAGMWSRQLAGQCGANVPVYPVEHPYLLSKTLANSSADLACVRDPDAAIYFRTDDSGQIVLGAFPKKSKPCLVDPIPSDFTRIPLPDDWSYVADTIRAAQHRIPTLGRELFEKMVNGPATFTPDTNFILGEAPEVDQLFVAAGFNGHSLAYAGGAGDVLAQWVIAGEQPYDLWGVDIRRFSPFQNNRDFLRHRVTETAGLQYRMAWPNYELESARGTRKSPLHDRLGAQGSFFGSKMAIERPIWFTRDGVRPAMDYSFGRQNWWECLAAEHRAARENVAAWDQSSFTKFILKGRDAVHVLDRLSPNYADVPIGKLVYSGMLNARGGYESDLCFARILEDEYYIVSGSAQPTRDYYWIHKHILPKEDAALTDVTHAYGVIGIMGPNSRKLLNELTDADLSLKAFPFSSAQWHSLANTNVLMIRITYVGELGWELHARMDQIQGVFDALQSVAKKYDLTHAGFYSINSLRMEKAYRAWGADITTGDTPYEAGLGFMVKAGKPVNFIGKQALLKQKETGVKRRLASFVVDDPDAMLWGGERIFRDGILMGTATSGYYGFTLGRALAFGYVKHDEVITTDFVLSGKYTIDFAGKQYPAKAMLQPPFDPKNERIMV
jgi:glycine cleavage system aminomethyltransferase T/glycine/D-amino acid oxidase-like deaminating enzyme